MPLGHGVIEQDRERQRRERAAGSALDDAGEHELQWRGRLGIEQQPDDEDRKRGLEHRPPAEAVREPSRHRQDDVARGDIGRKDPADLVVAHRQRALDVKQHRIGKRDVGRLHEGREQRRQPDRALAIRAAQDRAGAHSQPSRESRHAFGRRVSTRTVTLIPE